MLTALQEGSAAKYIKFTLLSLFGLAVAGMVFMDVGGFFRGGGFVSDTVAKIGSRSIGIQEFDRTASGYLRQQQMTVKDAYRAGLTGALLEGMIGRELMLQESARLGLVIDDKELAAQIGRLIKPQALGGETAQQTLDRLLRAQGMREKEFTQAMRGDLTLNILNQAVTGASATAPALLKSALGRGEAERRSVSYINVSPADLGIAPKPDEATLATYYKTVEQTYALPEARHFTALVFDSNALTKGVVIADADVQAEYEKSKDKYAAAEKRLVRQCIVNTEAEAKALQASGKLTGKNCQAPAEYERDGLPDALADAVFQAKAGTLLPAPVKSPFGWHVVKVEKTIAAGTKSLADVQKSIREDLRAERARALADDKISAIERSLSDGKPLADIVAANKAELRLADLPFVTADGKADKDSADIALVTKDKDVLPQLFEMLDGETSELQEVEDGVYAAFTVQEIRAAQTRPLKDVQAEISAAWVKTETARLMAEKIDALTKAAQGAESPIDALEKATGKKASVLKTLEPMVGDMPQEDLPFGGNNARAKVFRMNTGHEVAVFDDKDSEAKTLAVVTNAWFADNVKPTIQDDALAGLNTQLISDAMRGTLRNRHGVTINDKVLKRTYGTDAETEQE